VIWELETGAAVIEQVVLPKPTGFDAPKRLDTFLNVVRWGVASTADVRSIQSPFCPGIEVGMTILELILRHRARRVLIVRIGCLKHFLRRPAGRALPRVLREVGWLAGGLYRSSAADRDQQHKAAPHSIPRVGASALQPLTTLTSYSVLL
jgi:hypothetical protein